VGALLQDVDQERHCRRIAEVPQGAHGRLDRAEFASGPAPCQIGTERFPAGRAASVAERLDGPVCRPRVITQHGGCELRLDLRPVVSLEPLFPHSNCSLAVLGKGVEAELVGGQVLERHGRRLRDQRMLVRQRGEEHRDGSVRPAGRQRQRGGAAHLRVGITQSRRQGAR